MPRFVNVHGRFIPHNAGPIKVLNVNSKKKQNKKIQIDKLFKLENPQICINRFLGGIGDVLMSTPLLATLKRLLPHCTLIYVTDLEYASGGLKEIVDHCPYVDKVISAKESAKYRYDYSVNITTTGLDREHRYKIPPNRIDMFAEEVGIAIEDNPVPIYIITPEERERATKEIKTYLKRYKRKNINLIAIQVRSNDTRRTWPLDRMQQLINELAKNKYNRVIIMDWGKTVPLWETGNNIIPFMDRSIADTAAILEQCDIVVCPDSAILHLAGALNKKTVTIFGPIPPESRINHYPNTTVVDLNMPCRCFYQPSCIKETGIKRLACLNNISVEMVYETVIKKLEEEDKACANIKFGKDYSIAKQDNIILVKRKTRGIGDILMALNGIEALQNKFPKKEIHVAIPKSLHEILSYNPKIAKLIDSEQSINIRRYFMIADISSPCAQYESHRIAINKLVQKSRVEVFAESLGVRNYISDLLPRYYISEEERKNAQLFFKNKINKNKKCIYFALEAAEKYRSYPEFLWQKLIDKLKISFNIIFALRKTTPCNYKNIIDISELSFREKMAILELCEGCITVDTAPLHVAAALKIPTIAIFGPIDSRARCKGYKNTTILRSDLSCVPCWRNNIIKCKQKPKESAETYSKCLENISPHQIYNIVRKKFK